MPGTLRRGDGLLERLRDVRQKIIGPLDPHGDPDEAIGDAERLALGCGDRRVRGPRRERDQALGAAKTRREEEELERQQQKAKKEAEEYDPLKDPKNIEWMEEEIRKNKLVFGDDFGDDLNMDFDE